MGVMFVAGFSHKGETKMRFVEKGAKINSAYYIEKFLKPIIEKDAPKLFGKGPHQKPITSTSKKLNFYYESAMVGEFSGGGADGFCDHLDFKPIFVQPEVYDYCWIEISRHRGMAKHLRRPSINVFCDGKSELIRYVKLMASKLNMLCSMIVVV